MALLKTAGIEINKEQRTVHYQQQPLALKGLTFDMFLALVEANNEVVSIDTLAERVWKGKVVSDDTIAQRISLLRKALPEHASTHIESARSEGYRWLAKVDHTDINDASPKKKKLGAAVIVITLLIAVGFSVFWFSDQEQPLNDQMVLDPNNIPGHGLDADVFTRVKLARAQQYANALTAESNVIAVKMYRELLESDNSNPLFKLGLAQTLLYGVAEFNSDPRVLEEAESLSAELIELNQFQPQYLWLRGFYYETAKQMQLALDTYEAALAQSPDDPQITLSLANLYAEKGRLFEAMQLNVKPSIRGESRQLRQIARLLYLTDQTELARDWLNASLQLAPNDASASFELAKFLMVNDRPTEAMEVITEFHQSAKGNAESHLLEFFLQLYFEETNLAETALIAAEAAQPESVQVLAWRQWFNKQQAKPLSFIQVGVTKTDWPTSLVAGCVQAMANDNTQEALLLLTRALRLGYLDYKYILHMPAFIPLQDNPMFNEILLLMQQRQIEEKRRIVAIQIPELGSS